MKKLLILLSITFLFISCDDDDYLTGIEEEIIVSFNGTTRCPEYSSLKRHDNFTCHPVQNMLPDTIDGNPFYFAKSYIVTYKYLEENTTCISGADPLPGEDPITYDLQLVEILSIREK